MARRRRRLRLTLARVAILAISVGLAVGCGKSAPPTILVVGLDGADWAILDRLMAAGELPHLSELKREGTTARLASMEPMLSPILWTTMATGKTADKHGITWFLVDNPKTGGRMPITSNVRKVKAFWNILSEQKPPLDVGVVGWWATWPAEPVHGFVVSDFTGFHGFGVTGRDVGTDLGKTHPPELLKEIAPLLRGPESITYDELSRFAEIPRAEFEKVAASRFDFKLPIHHLRNILATAASYRDIATRLLSERKPRVMAVYFEGIDSASHLFMPYAPPQRPGIVDADFQRFHRVVDAYYRYQDEMLGELIAAAGRDATTIVVSDHGFKSGAERPDPVPGIEVQSAHRWHQPYGVLLAKGPDIRRGHELAQASILDLTPTLLYLMGIAKGADMDGAVLTDLLTPEFVLRHPVESTPTYEGAERGPEIPAPDPGTGGEVEERLRALGYIGSGDESSSEVHGNLGNIELHSGDVIAAEEAFRKSTELDPLNPQAHLGLSFIYRSQGRLRDAIRESKFALDLRPGALDLVVDLGDLWFDFGDHAEAQAYYARALGKKPDHVGATIGLGNVHRMRGELDEARKLFERARELAPLNFVALYNLGVLAQAEGRAQEARELYEQARALAPKEPTIHNNLGSLAEAAGDLEQAVQSFRAARDADPRHFESRYNLGSVLLRLDRAREAEPILREALALRPDSVFAHNNLANAYLRLGWFEKAERELALLARLDPKAPEPVYQLSRLRAAGGDATAARRLLAEAIAIGGQPFRDRAAADPLLRKAGIEAGK